MQVLLTGGTGFIGSALVAALRSRGDEVIVLSRVAHADRAGCRFIRHLDELSSAQPVDTIINLAGASLAARRWTAAYKREIVASRLETTRALHDLVTRLEAPPRVLLNASAIGYYGHHGDEALTESAAVVPGFAQRLCADWEALARSVGTLGPRVCLLRFGVVLDAGGGALAEMTRSFRLGVASWLGAGGQWLSWVHRRDAVDAMLFLLDREELDGAFNVTAPEPVTARAFARALQRHHRTVISAGVPAPVARVLLGEMADELLLNGQRVVPDALVKAGFRFRHATLASALAAVYSH